MDYTSIYRYNDFGELLKTLNIQWKRKRFSKWVKPDTNSDIEVVKEYYGYSDEKARQVISLFTSDQLKTIRQKVYKGGRK